MNLIEKNLYQQIHPLRLATDWSTGFASCYLFWQQEVAGALIVAFIPSLFVSLVVMRFVDLERTKNSAFGRYYKRTHKQWLDTVRLVGFIIMAVAAYNQSLAGIGAGLAAIILTWTYGLFTPKN